MINKPLQSIKKIELSVEGFSIFEQVNRTKSFTQSQHSDVAPTTTQQNNILYERIIPSQPQKLDVESIIAEYNMIAQKNIQKESKKEKPKHIIKKTKQEVNKMSLVPKMIISQDSIALINEFKKILNQKFVGFMNQLAKQRKSCLQRLFNYLCFGFQQISDSFKNEPSSMNILSSINKEDILMLLKQRSFAIDFEILNTHKNSKRNQPTLKFKNQWKFILDLLKQPKNSKLRQAIIIDEVQPSLLVYARQIDLIKYLSPQRQKKLQFQAQQILRNSYTDKDWILTHSEKQTDQTPHDEEKSQISTAHESVEQAITPTQKTKKVKSKEREKIREIEIIDVRAVKKLRKINENVTNAK